MHNSVPGAHVARYLQLDMCTHVTVALSSTYLINFGSYPVFCIHTCTPVSSDSTAHSRVESLLLVPYFLPQQRFVLVIIGGHITRTKCIAQFL